MSTLSWVIGRGGLLGSSLERAIRAPVWHPEYLFPWDNPAQLRKAITDSVQRFRVHLLSEKVIEWNIYWCAGAGVVGSSAEQFSAETATLRFFLDQLGGAIASLPPGLSGQFFLASSAGGVYGGSIGRPLTEATTPHPISDYGRAKLEHEQLVRDWSCTRPNISTLAGRLSNLYGPGQHLEKPQGLISHMSRCLIFSVPIRIFVPLDTIRDYLFVDDAARRIVAGMQRLRREVVSDGHVTKIFASGSETSVARLIGIFRQIAKRHLRLISAQSAIRSQQPLGLQFRSVIWPDEPSLPHTELLDGVNRVHNHQLAVFQEGRLASPRSGLLR